MQDEGRPVVRKDRLRFSVESASRYRIDIEDDSGKPTSSLFREGSSFARLDGQRRTIVIDQGSDEYSEEHSEWLGPSVRPGLILARGLAEVDWLRSVGSEWKGKAPDGALLEVQWRQGKPSEIRRIFSKDRFARWTYDAGTTIEGSWFPTRVTCTPPADSELKVSLDARISDVRSRPLKADLRFDIPQDGFRLVDRRAGVPFEITVAQIEKAYPGRRDLTFEEIARLRDSLMADLRQTPPERPGNGARSVLLGGSLFVLGLVGWVWARRLRVSQN